MELTSRPYRGWHRTIALAAGLAASSTVLLMSASPGAAQVPTCSSFDAVAAADGLRTEFFDPGQFIVEQADTQGPAAQAQANAAGISNAYAGAPYPGDSVVSGIGLAGGDARSVPTFVATQYPTDPTEGRSTPALTLQAQSRRTTADASAIGGGGSGDQLSAGRSTSTARAGCDAKGNIAANAVTDSEAASFAAGTLRLGRVRSSAQAKVAANGSTELTSDLVTGSFTVAGQTVALTAQGLVLPGSTTPLPTNPLGSALAGAGIAVSYIASVKDPDGAGITAPGLQVRLSRDTGGTAPSVVTYTFGRARARTSGAPGSALGAVSHSTGGSGDINQASHDDSSAGTKAVSSPLVSGDNTRLGATPVDAATGGALSGGALTGGALTVAEPPTTAAPDRAQPLLASAARVDATTLSLANIYLALVVGAVAVFAAGTLLRVIGVKLAWI